jgi:hypothetical protein
MCVLELCSLLSFDDAPSAVRAALFTDRAAHGQLLDPC